MSVRGEILVNGCFGSCFDMMRRIKIGLYLSSKKRHPHMTIRDLKMFECLKFQYPLLLDSANAPFLITLKIYVFILFYHSLHKCHPRKALDIIICSLFSYSSQHE